MGFKFFRLPGIEPSKVSHTERLVSALGGFLGYRQAKAGYVLRAAGTVRFLQ